MDAQYVNAERMLDARVGALEARLSQEQAQAMDDIDRRATVWKEQVQRDLESQQTMTADAQTSGLRQQLAEAQRLAQKLDQSENSLAKSHGETERLLHQERLRAAHLRDQVNRTETELTSSGSWSEVGSQRPPVQQGEARDANGPEQQRPQTQKVFPESVEEDALSSYSSSSPGRGERTDLTELMELLARNQMESNENMAPYSRV